MRTFTLYGAKNFGFLEIYDVTARTKGLSQCVHFANKRGWRGSIFRDFVRTIFIDGQSLINDLLTFKPVLKIQ